MFARITKLGLLVLALTVGLGAAAQAGHPAHHHHHGHTHDGYGIPRGPHGAPHGLPHHSGYGARRPVYHDTTHLDWHPGGFVPHRNHYHYVPGHYDVHRSGHWHW